MRPRDLSFLLGALLVLAFASVGVVALGGENEPVAPPGAAQPEAEPAPAGTQPAAVAATGELAGSDSIAPAEAALHRAREDTTGWTHGLIRGDVQLAVSVVDRIQSLQVIVEELRNPIGPDGKVVETYRRVERVERGVGTPTFTIRDVPFSDYGYLVTLYSPGLNGGRQTVALDARSPTADVTLSLLSPAPFTLLVRDQDGNPCAGVDVHMLPTGEPPGRPAQNGTTDSFGSCVFEKVLAGDYQAWAGPANMPLDQPRTITVQPGGRLYGARVQAQGETLVVRRGVPVEVMAVDPHGYGVADATVKVVATDRVRLTHFEAVTDASGRATFPSLTPGVWQIDVGKADHQTATVQLTIKEGAPPPRQDVRLVRLRW
jgi:hypothetical protein